jgi:hypothetical protein
MKTTGYAEQMKTMCDDRQELRSRELYPTLREVQQIREMRDQLEKAHAAGQAYAVAPGKRK